MHPHFHGHGPRGHGLADPPQADDAQRLAGQLRAHELLAVPAAFDQALVGRGDVPHQAVHQGQRLLGGGDRVAAGRVHDHDALPGGGLGVDVVDAHARPGDRLEPMVPLERFGGDLHAAAADRAVELRQGRFQGLALQSRADFDFDIRGRSQQIQAVVGKVYSIDRFRPSSERSSRTMILAMVRSLEILLHVRNPII